MQYLKPKLLTDEEARPYLDAIQTEVLELALKARPGSEMRRFLCDAVTWHPERGYRNSERETEDDGGIERAEIVSILRRINEARENGDDPRHLLRQLRNRLENSLDIYDLEPE